jgi:D-psicose/D-tagatose/L-ribulose 3-epimerase
MIRFGMHSSLWTSAWTRECAERSVSECARYGLQVVEIALLEPDKVGERAGELRGRLCKSKWR